MPNLNELEQWRQCYLAIRDHVSVVGVKREVENLSETLVTELDEYGDRFSDPFDGSWPGGNILAFSIYRATACQDETYESDLESALHAIEILPQFHGTIANNELVIQRSEDS